MSRPKTIVLTGGPGAGKTVVTTALLARHPDRLVLVPEAATAVYLKLDTRWDRLDTDGRRRVQTLMYEHQLDQEARYAADHPGKILLLDRGTIDGAAYWPDGADQFWPAVKTTLPDELARYDAVLWLETAAALGIYDGAASNVVRFEDASAAVDSGRRLLDLWQPHPHLHHVGAFARVEDKVAAVVEIVDALLT
ncbi:MAG TPA: AAA family ATPase [Tepidisphaeraceae bacterium]